ncbi:MAG TPA: EamA family transporter [Candidatus Sulfotelmatobacter sp.]|nr:EamA family transporter [Candidatus Sulfotelmatobacter sp.]
MTADRAATRATLFGLSAIGLWSTLALLTRTAGPVPPFELIALSFGIAALLYGAKWLLAGDDPRRHLALPAVAWAVGVGGLFGFHLLYFIALRLAPAVQANLINYLWPLLIVLFAAGDRLRASHVLGALAGLAGTVVLVGGGGAGFDPNYVLGYGLAFAAALVWAGYSVLSRRLARISSDAVGGFCALTALLALACHLGWEPTRWPSGLAWWAVLGLGLGPVGAAFFLWDVGVKRGNIRVLGSASYMAPFLSTMLLVWFGHARLSLDIAVAGLLIVGGAVLGSYEMWQTARGSS